MGNDSLRENRYLDFVLQFSSNIRHIPGKANLVAAALSRLDVDALNAATLIDFYAMARAAHLSRSDPLLMHAALKLEDVSIGDTRETIICDISTGKPRPFVPRRMRRDVFSALHNLSHPCKKATMKLISECFIWPYIVGLWAKTCLLCQQSKISRHTRIPFG